MKKITTVLTLCTVLFSGSAFAQDSSMKSSDQMKNQPPCRANKEFAWGTAVTALAVLGVVVGLTASQATGYSNGN